VTGISTKDASGRPLKMRSYQMEALNFFTELHMNNVEGGILADEMVRP
jgi:hypothetical protein